MKKLKKLIIIGMAVFALAGLSITALAASQYSTRAEVIAGLTENDVSTVIERHAQTGETFGMMAKEAGVLEKFRDEKMEMLKDKLDARVAEGSLTRDQADAIMEKIEEHQASCDGTNARQRQHVNQGMSDGHGFCNNQGQRKSTGQKNFGGGNGQGVRGRMSK